MIGIASDAIRSATHLEASATRRKGLPAILEEFETGTEQFSVFPQSLHCINSRAAWRKVL
jgi:hypothetical protein